MNIEIAQISAAADGSIFGAAWYGPSQGIYEYDTTEEMWISCNELPPDYPITLNGVWAGSKDNVWAVGGGENGEPQKLFNRKGNAWVEVGRPVCDDHAVRPIVGTDGTVWLFTMLLDGTDDQALWRYVEGGWALIKKSAVSEIWDLTIEHADSVWAVKNDGRSSIFKYSPDGWIAFPGPEIEPGWRSLYLESIEVGANGIMTVLGTFYNDPANYLVNMWQRTTDSSQWTKLPQPVLNQISAISVGSATNMWGVGYQGSMAIYQWSAAHKQWHAIITADTPGQQVIVQVQATLHRLISLIDHFQKYLQNHVNELYRLVQVQDHDPGQAYANMLLQSSCRAIGGAAFPGAKNVAAVLGGIINWVVTDYSPDLSMIFADAWTRLSKNFQFLRTTLNTIRANVNEYWSYSYTNPLTREVVKVADLLTSDMPVEGKAFNDLLLIVLKAARYNLWQQVLPTKWHKFSLINPPIIVFNTQAGVEAFIKNYLDKNANYHIVPYQEEDRWYIYEWWLGYGNFPFGHHEAPTQLCETLFIDDDLGNIVQKNAITTRADVFTNWHLQEQKVVVPPSTRQRRQGTQEKFQWERSMVSGLV